MNTSSQLKRRLARHPIIGVSIIITLVSSLAILSYSITRIVTATLNRSNAPITSQTQSTGTPFEPSKQYTPSPSPSIWISSISETTASLKPTQQPSVGDSNHPTVTQIVDWGGANGPGSTNGPSPQLATTIPTENPTKQPVLSAPIPATTVLFEAPTSLPCCSGTRITYTLATKDIDDFGYYIDHPDPTEVASSPFDLVIIDYYSAGASLNMEFTPADVLTMKGVGNTEKVLLSYISIGEAEDYRFYWERLWEDGDDGPSWLGEENPDWYGNYKVEYWDESWQEIVYESLDKIIDAGFDGIYCDIIDAYEYYEDQGRDTAAEEMVQFVSELSEYAKRVASSVDPGREFFIFVQNGSELLNDPRYLQVIDGIGQEDLFFYESSNQPANETARISANLDLAKRAGKAVLVVEYISTEGEACHFYQECEKQGYLCHAAQRDLNQLLDNICYPAT